MQTAKLAGEAERGARAAPRRSTGRDARHCNCLNFMVRGAGPLLANSLTVHRERPARCSASRQKLQQAHPCRLRPPSPCSPTLARRRAPISAHWSTATCRPRPRCPRPRRSRARRRATIRRPPTTRRLATPRRPATDRRQITTTTRPRVRKRATRAPPQSGPMAHRRRRNRAMANRRTRPRPISQRPKAMTSRGLRRKRQHRMARPPPR